MTTTTTQVGGLSVDVSSGTGRPIIFIHGNSSSSATFAGQMDSELGSTHRCLALNLPGHGASDALGGVDDYTLAAYAGAVAAVAAELTDAPPILVGWSLGGHVALEALTVMPDLAGVCIYGTPPLSNPPDMESSFLPNPAMGVGFSPEVSEDDAKAYASSFFAPGSTVSVDACVADILATDGNARAGAGVSLGALNFADEVQLVAAMSQPLAILHGAGEQLVSREYFNQLEAPTLWTGQVHDIDGAGHAPHLETPEAFNSLVARFVSDCP